MRHVSESESSDSDLAWAYSSALVPVYATREPTDTKDTTTVLDGERKEAPNYTYTRTVNSATARILESALNERGARNALRVQAKSGDFSSLTDTITVVDNIHA